MNGQIYQLASLTAAAKKSLKEHRPIKFTPMKYINRVEFSFLPQKKFFGTKEYTAFHVSSWFDNIYSKGLEDIKLICPIDVKDRQLLGFSNTTESCILCFFGDKSVTDFTPEWEFDAVQQQWNVRYIERQWPDPPSAKPRFDNNFRKILTNIEDFAIQIDCIGFAKIFSKARDILDGSGDLPDIKYGLDLPQIPAANIQIFEAASLADVFGAMGSWNDSPPHMAHEKGLDSEYEALSSELLKNIRFAILYAINEW